MNQCEWLGYGADVLLTHLFLLCIRSLASAEQMNFLHALLNLCAASPRLPYRQPWRCVDISL